MNKQILESVYQKNLIQKIKTFVVKNIFVKLLRFFSIEAFHQITTLKAILLATLSSKCLDEENKNIIFLTLNIDK